MTEANQIAVVILAGGQGRRIGGTKSEKMLDGQSLLSHAVTKAQRWSDKIAISIRAKTDPVRVSDYPLLYDDSNISGPLSGLASALAFATSHDRTFVLTIACDTPFLPDDLACKLRSGIGTGRAAMAQCGARVQPLCSLWSSDVADDLAHYTQPGGSSLIGFAEMIGYTAVQWSPDNTESFFNINTLQDLHRAQERHHS